MASQKLFLWEFLISRIKFDPGTISVPTYDSLMLQFRCSNFLWSEISTDEFPVEGISTDFKPSNGEFNIKIGKASLIPFNPDVLLKELQNNPLIVDIAILRRWVASSTFKWTPDFINFVKGTSGGASGSGNVNFSTIFEFTDSAKKKVATANLNIKLSCVGENVETYFTFKNREPTFMNPKTHTEFKCEKVVGVDVIPSILHTDSKISWMGLYEGKMVAADQISVAPPFVIDDMAKQAHHPKPAKIPDTTSRTSAYWDTISIKFRPAENRFMDFLNIMADEAVLMESTPATGAAKSKKGAATFADTVGVHSYAQYEDEYDDKEGLELTSEKIMKKLCTNPACPAAKKFKEYGLGPLATGTGLGTLYKKVEPSKTYRRSNTYGVFTRYGPYGVFAKSEYPFFPPKEDDTEVCPIDFPCLPDDEGEEVCSCTEKTVCDCCGTMCRLRGGEEKHLKKEKRKKCCCCKHKHHDGKDVPLRLRGGGLADPEDQIILPFITTYQSTVYDNVGCNLTTVYGEYYDINQYSRLRAGGKCEDEKPGQLKSAMVECKSVMDQFDEILLAYRKALGPCGEATCPFSQNMVEKNCKKICLPPPRDPCPCVPTDSCQEMPCTIDACPYKEKPKKGFPAGCGSPKCPYAQYKMGLMDADAEMELAFLPPPIQGKCGDPKCDYPPQNVKLPPIHWDCPDPLPQGVCKNPNCPHQPKDLKEIKVPVPKAPCGSSACPYALPPPCDLPSCPFRQKPCPFQAQKKGGEKKPSCNMESSSESDDDSVCCNPDCPYKQTKPRPKADTSGGCNNPKCAYGQVQNPKKKKKNPGCVCKEDSDSEESFCDSPECPLNRRKPKDDACENPECPTRVQKRHAKRDAEEETICDNKDCPYRNGMGNKDDDDACDNPTCPYKNKGKGDNIECSNPGCPYKGSAGVKDDDDDGSICSCADCPFLKRRKQPKGDDTSICENPSCPFKNKKDSPENDEVCDGCDGNVCENPECPNYKSGGGARGPKGPDYCDNPMCPFSQEYQTAICVDPFCPYAQPLPSCGIPNCPYEKKPIMYCPSPICPSKFPPTNVAAPPPPPQGNARTSIEGKEKKRRRSSEEKRKKENEGSGDAPSKTTTAKENTVVSAATETKEHSRKSPYVYSFGDQWPGVKIGHRECLPPRFRVPPKMGWMWKIQQPYFGCKMRRGWRPGCIEKIVAAMIRAHREAKGLGLLMLPDFGKGGKRRRGAGTESDDDLHVNPKPTLHITKKDGAYMITMNPLKDPFSLAENEDPYMDCTPMQFKITKNKLKAADDDLCHCNDPPEEDSDDSELDIEFTPPAGIIHPDRFKKKKNVIHCESQYNPADFAEKKKAKKGDKKGDKKGGKGAKDKGKKKEKKKVPSFC